MQNRDGEMTRPRELNDRVLEEEYFPALARRLKETGAVYVGYDVSSHFSHFLMRHDYDLWMATEQTLGITEEDEDKALFFLRR